jgi:hypothetical protein
MRQAGIVHSRELLTLNISWQRMGPVALTLVDPLDTSISLLHKL